MADVFDGYTATAARSGSAVAVRAGLPRGAAMTTTEATELRHRDDAERLERQLAG